MAHTQQQFTETPVTNEIPDAIAASGLSVEYRRCTEPVGTMKEGLLRWMKFGQFAPYSTFCALDDVTFRLKQGNALGILGSNGSGKSTLLKVLAGVLSPTAGQVTIRGNVAALIELGAGFDPELNAVENIMLNGLLHRKSREFLESRVDHILDFSELREFAYTPVKYYSSGMYARLGFSVAVDIDPDVLLVDEILGVGDERFQAKCFGVFEQFIAQRKTIIIVSHDTAMIEEFCSQCLVLSRGKARFLGSTQEAVEIYRSGEYETALTA